MSRIRPKRLSRREQNAANRAAVDGVSYAAERCVFAAEHGLVDLLTGQGAALDIARRLRCDVARFMAPRSRLRGRRA